MSCRIQFFFLRTLFNYGIFVMEANVFFNFDEFFLLIFFLSPLLRIRPRMMLCCYMLWHKSHQLFFSFRSLTDCDENCRVQQFLMRKLSYCFANSQKFCSFVFRGEGEGKRIHCDVLSSLHKQVCRYQEDEIKKKQIIEKLFPKYRVILLPKKKFVLHLRY